MPVASASRTFAPIFLHVSAVNINLVRGAFVEASEITAQHHEVSTHSQSQSHVVIINDTTIGANGNINAGLSVVIITSLAYINQSSCLAAANALLLTSDADGATADADLDEVCASVSQEAEAFSVNNVTSANLYAVTIMFTNPVQSNLLPSAIAFGGVNAEHVNTSVNQCGHTLSIIAGVNTSANDMAFFAVQQLQGIFLVSCIVLAEYHVQQTAFIINDGQSVQLLFPNDIVSLLQGGILTSNDHLVNRSHKVANLGGTVHAAGTIVTAGNDTFQLAVNGAIAGYSHGGVTGALLQSQDISQSAVRTNVRIAANKACTMCLYASNHSCLVLNGLGAIDEGNAALFGQSNCQLFTGNSLHDCRYHGDIHGDGRFLTFFKLYERSAQIYIRRNAFFRGITRN